MKLLRTLALASLLSAAVLTYGCNTIRGMGQDVESGGKTIQDVAEESKPSS